MILRENGSFNLNGYQLKMEADCKVFIERIDQDLSYTANGFNLTLNENLAFNGGSNYSLVFDDRWKISHFLRASQISGETMGVEYVPCEYALSRYVDDTDTEIESPYIINVSKGEKLVLRSYAALDILRNANLKISSLAITEWPKKLHSRSAIVMMK